MVVVMVMVIVIGGPCTSGVRERLVGRWEEK